MRTRDLRDFILSVLAVASLLGGCAKDEQLTARSEAPAPTAAPAASQPDTPTPLKSDIDALLDAAPSIEEIAFVLTPGEEDPVGEAAVKRRLRDGDSVHVRDRNGATMLHWAAAHGQAAIAEFLLQQGALVNAQDNEGNTALHVAAANGHAELVQLLLVRGADTSVANQRGELPETLTSDADVAALFKQVRRSAER